MELDAVILSLGRYDYFGTELLDELDASGHEELVEWCAERLPDARFRAALLKEAQDDYDLNGDDEGGYDEMSSLIGSVRLLKARGEFTALAAEIEEDLKTAALEEQLRVASLLPRERPSALAEDDEGTETNAGRATIGE